MELTFAKKDANTHIATGENGNKYTLLLMGANKLFTVKQDSTIIGKGIKGYVNAKDIAQDTENEIETEEEEITTSKGKGTPMAKITNSKTTTPVKTTAVPAKSAPAKATAPVKQTAKPVAAPVATRTKKIKPFPTLEEWIEENVTLLPETGRNKTANVEANRKTLMGAKLKHGKARKAYNVANGLEDATVTAKAKREPAEPKEKLTKTERFGDMWNEFADDEKPSPLEYILAQLTNGRASRNYGVAHGMMHPHSAIAANSYFKAVERCYRDEQRLATYLEETGTKIPEGIEFEYLRGTGFPETNAPEGYSALAVYEEFYTADSNPFLKGEKNTYKLAKGQALPLPDESLEPIAVKKTRTVTRR